MGRIEKWYKNELDKSVDFNLKIWPLLDALEDKPASIIQGILRRKEGATGLGILVGVVAVVFAVLAIYI